MSEQETSRKTVDDIVRHIKIGFNIEKNKCDIQDVVFQGDKDGNLTEENKWNKGIRISRYYDKKRKYVYYFYKGSYLGEYTGVVTNVIFGNSDLKQKDEEEGFFGPDSGLTRQDKNMRLAEKELSKGREKEDMDAEKIIRVGHSLGGYKAMVATLVSAVLDENFDPKKNEVILVNSLGLSNKVVKYFSDRLDEETFNAIKSNVFNVNCVEDYVSPMNENVFGKTFYFGVRKNYKNCSFFWKHPEDNLDLNKQISFDRNCLFWRYFYDSMRKSQNLLGPDNFCKLLHALFSVLEKEDIYENENKLQRGKVFISVAIIIKSYISAYFRSLSTGRRVLFGFGVLSSIGAITLACANALAISFLLAFPPAALIATAVTLGCVGLVSMISSFVGINWREPVEESETEAKQICGQGVNEIEQAKKNEISEHDIENKKTESFSTENKEIVAQTPNESEILFEEILDGTSSDNVPASWSIGSENNR